MIHAIVQAPWETFHYYFGSSSMYFAAQGGHKLCVNRASELAERYVSSFCHAPAESLIALHEAQIGSSPCKTRTLPSASRFAASADRRRSATGAIANITATAMRRFSASIQAGIPVPRDDQ